MMITKKMKYFLVFIIMLVTVSPVLADTNDNIVDFSRKGSISIILSEEAEGLKVGGASITIYKVADAYSKDSNLAFNYHDNLKEYENDLNEGIITSDMLKLINESELFSFNELTNEFGVVEFNDLDLGLYLVIQTNQVKGFSKIEPFLVFIPEIIDNKWVYDIEATPKVDIIRLFDLTVEKVWNVSDKDNVPNKVTIELLMDDEVIDTIVLNKDNDWTYTWEQIEKSDKYSVREIEVPAGYIASYRSEGNKFIVTNTKSLVQTGQKRWIVSMLAGLGIFFIILGFVFEKRKSYE